MSQAVRLTVMPDAAQMPRGGQLSLSLTIHNTGTTRDRYRLGVSGIPDDWYALDQRPVALGPGARAHVDLHLHPPASAAPAADNYLMAVQVTSEDAPTVAASAVVALTLGGGGLSMDVAPAEAVGRQATFCVTFLNQLNRPAALGLAAREDEDGLSVRTEPAQAVIVPVGGKGTVTVRARPKARETMGVPRTYDIEFRGVDLGSLDPGPAGELPPYLVRRVRFTYVPRSGARVRPPWVGRVPVWAVLLPLVLLLPLLVFAGERVRTSVSIHGVPGLWLTLHTPSHSAARTRRPTARLQTGAAASPWWPAILVNPNALDFGPQHVDTVSTRHIHVVNLGPRPLTVTAITITGNDPGDFAEGDTCAGRPVAVDGGCTITVLFTPLRRGSRRASLLISDAAPGSPQEVPLNGQG